MKHIKLLWLFVFGVSAVVCATSPFPTSPFPCTYTNTDGVRYDLTRMYRNSTQSEYFYDTGSPTFSINICGQSKEPCSPQNGNCQNMEGTYYGCGDASKAQFSDYYPRGTEGVQIIYPSGESCNGVARVTTLNIKCDPSAGDGIITSYDETVTCRYTFGMSSKWACPVSDTPHFAWPNLSSLNATVYAYGAVRNARGVPVSSSGKGTFLYNYPGAYSDDDDDSMRRMELSYVDEHGQGTVGLIGSPSIAVYKPPGTFKCPISDSLYIRDALQWITDDEDGHPVPDVYTYQYFNQGQKRPVLRWGRHTLQALTDAKTGDLVWAPFRAFGDIDDDDGGELFLEFDPTSYRTIVPGYSWLVPAAWNCSISV